MNYFIVAVENISEADIPVLLSRVSTGILTFFSIQNDKFYYVYLSKKVKCLTPYWRRGLSLEDLKKSDFKKLKFVRQLKPDSFRQVRREDFKIILSSLYRTQQQRNHWIHLQVSENKIFFANIDQEEFGFEKILINGKKKLKIFANEFINQIQLDVLHHRHINITIRKFREDILKEYPQLGQLSEIHANHFRVIVSGESFKVLILLTRILSIQAKILSLPKKIYISHIPNQIRRVLVVTNLSGSSLKSLNENEFFWDTGVSGYNWKHIAGKFSGERLKKLFLSEQKHDLLIYRGHSYVKKDGIVWSSDSSVYTIKKMKIPIYIHLACLNFQNIENEDIRQLPFEEGILPFGFLPDQDYSTMIRFLFDFIKKGYTFKNACRSLFKDHKEYGASFAYWS